MVNAFDNREGIFWTSRGRLAEDPLELRVQFLDQFGIAMNRRRLPNAS